MSMFDNYKGGVNSFGTRYVDGLFKPSIRYSATPKFKQEYTDQIVEGLRAPRPYAEQDSERSFLDRGLDALMAPTYAIAGAVDGAIRDDKTILEGFGQGLKAANPFGKGFEQGETTFSDVIRSGLQKAGKDEPDTFLGKALVGTTGFALDVLLDPTTYMTLGISAAVKGTGRVGKAAQTIETLAKNNPEFAAGIREAGGMSDELAQEIVMKANNISSFDEIADSARLLAEGGDDVIGKKISQEQFQQEVIELKKTYNDLLGVGRTGEGISIGVKNMPFGDFVARKLGIESAPKVLIKDDTIRAVSDAVGMSSAWQASRNAFYGSKIGQALSRNAGLKKLAESDPAKVYEYIGALNKMRGKDLDKMAKEKHIKEYSEKLLGLSPAEQKKIIQALENPSLWDKTTEKISKMNMSSYAKLQTEYKLANEELKSSIAQAKTITDEYIDASTEELKHYKTEVAELKRLKTLAPQQQRTLNELDTELNNLITKRAEIENRFAIEKKDYGATIKQLEDELDNITSVREAKLAGVESGNAYKTLPKEELDAMIDEKLLRIKQIDPSMANGSKEVTNFALNKQVEQTNLRKLVSDILFQNDSVIPPSVSADRIESIAHAIKAGDDGRALEGALKGEFGGYNFHQNFQGARELNFILENNVDTFDALKEMLRSGNLMSDEMKDVYSYLGTKYGYKSITPIRDKVKDAIAVLNLKYDGKLSRPLKDDAERAMYQEYLDNMELLVARGRDLQEIAKVGDAKAQAKYVRKLELEETKHEMYELLYGNDVQATMRQDRLIEISDTRKNPEYAGTKYDQKNNVEDMKYAEEATTWGKSGTPREVEIENMRKAFRDEPYSYDETSALSRPIIKEVMLKNRRQALINYRLSPDAKKVLKELNNKATKLNEIKALYRTYKDKDQFVKRYDEAMNEYKAIRDRAEKTTNLFTVSKQLDEISPEETKTLSAQLEAGVFLQHKLHPNHQFEDLTSGQQARITGKAFALTKKYIKENGIPTKKDVDKFYSFIEKEGVEAVISDVAEEVTKRSELGHSLNTASKVGYYTGIEFKVGDKVERGYVVGIKEDTVKKSRKEMDVKMESHHQDDAMEWIETPRLDPKTKEPILNKKTGKPVMKRIMKPVVPRQTKHQTVKTIEYEEGIGSYTYQVEFPGGITTVKQSDIVGTWNNVTDEFAVKTPKFIEEEIDRITDEMQALKDRIRANKGAETRQNKKIISAERTKVIKLEQLNKVEADLIARKEQETFFLEQYSNLIDEKEDYVRKLFDATSAEDIATRNAKQIDSLEKGLDEMVQRQEQIEKALQDNELFEDLIKLDFGDDAVKFYDEIDVEDGKFVIDKLTDWDENLKQTAKAIRKDLYDAGLAEVGTGKLDKGAFETMADKYFPRTLSEEGNAFFDNNPDYAQKYLSPTKGYGFGKQFNEHVLRRNDELRDKTIEQANDYFQSKVGVRIFEENLGKAYLNRMMTSSEMVYDSRAMEDLMYRFGHKVKTTRDGNNNFMEGYERVINYGQVKQIVREKVIAQIKRDYPGKMEREQFEVISKQLAQDLINKAGLDPKILDGETTPLIKLADEQVHKVRQVLGSDTVRQVNSMTVNRTNQVRELTMQRDEKKMLQLYDKFMTFFKLNQTTVMPAFHVRNHMGAMFVGWLGVGRDALSIGKQRDAYQALKLYGKDMELRNLKPVVTDDGTRVYRYDEIMDYAKTYAVIDEGFMMKDFSAQSYSKGTGLIPGKYDPFNTKDFGLYKIGSKIATYSDNIQRITQFSSLLKQGKTPAEASDIVRKYMFDYSDLTSFEMNWMKRIFPYYTYMRKNLPMMSNEFLDSPEKLQLVAKISNLPEGMVNEEDKVAEGEKVGFAQDWLQMPFGGNSLTGKEPILMNPNLPYMQLRDIDMGGNIGEQARTLFSQSAPMLKVPIELATNWNSFFDDEIVGEEGNQISPRVVHAMSQLAGFNAVSQFMKAKTGDDKVLSLLNTGTGIKMTTYDVEGAKEKIYEEAYNKDFELSIKNIIGTGVAFGKDFSNNAKANLSRYAVQLAGEPYKAIDETGVKAPVSIRTYDEMSDEQRKLYTFDEKTKAYVNNEALKFEQEQFEKSGVFKKFAWMLVESTAPDKTITRVERVKDGDTFVASQGDKSFDVRLLLVDTPEMNKAKDNLDPQAFAPEAEQYTSDMILGKDVKLHIGGKDHYGRTLAFVEVAGKSLQDSLVEEGLAKVRQYDKNYTSEAEALYNLEEEAWKDKKGVWSRPGNASPRSNTGFVR